jgi:hypothetical protein
VLREMIQMSERTGKGSRWETSKVVELTGQGRHSFNQGLSVDEENINNIITLVPPSMSMSYKSPSFQMRFPG